MIDRSLAVQALLAISLTAALGGCGAKQSEAEPAASESAAAPSDPQAGASAAPSAMASEAVAAKADKVSFPPIPQGYYAAGQSCAAAIASGSDMDPPLGLVKFDAKAIGEWDGSQVISGFREIGGGRWKVLARSYGNGDDPVGMKSDFVIRVTGPGSFIDESSGIKHVHCPKVPAAIRAHYG